MNVCVKLFAFGAIVRVVVGENELERLPVHVPVPDECLAKPLCGGIADTWCPRGYTCVYRLGADIGDCCPDDPIPVPTPLTSTCLANSWCGGAAGPLCLVGYTCRYRPGTNVGECCLTTRPVRPDPCYDLGQDGVCGGIAGIRCRPGTVCVGLDDNPDGMGLCCITRPVVKPPVHEKPDPCNNLGHDGICGGIANLQCRPGTKCTSIGLDDVADGHGLCCIYVKPDPCNNLGQDGICGGIANLQCRPGTKCTSIGLDDVADGHGVCCITRSIITPPVYGSCPPPSDFCQLVDPDPNTYCRNDSDCRKYSRCCPERCGLFCKRVYPYGWK